MERLPISELGNLRGERLSWVVARRSPLHCAFRSSEGTTGHIVPSLEDPSLLATLAGVRRRIAHHPFHDAVAFEGGPEVADAKVWAGGHGYKAEIDGFARYRFEDRRENRRQKTWTDDGGRSVVVFAPHGEDGRVTSGEIVVNASGLIEHLPILILLGVVHLSNL